MRDLGISHNIRSASFANYDDTRRSLMWMTTLKAPAADLNGVARIIKTFANPDQEAVAVGEWIADSTRVLTFAPSGRPQRG